MVDDERFRQAMAEESVQQKADEGQERDEPQMKAVVHSFIRFDLVDVERVPGAEDGDDDGQAYGGFSRGHHHDEEDEDLPADLMPLVREGDEGQVDGVEHQLDRHEDGDDVALDEEGGNAEREEDGAEHEIVGDRDNHVRTPFAPARQRRGWRPESGPR